jgi:hypothetical protein
MNLRSSLCTVVLAASALCACSSSTPEKGAAGNSSGGSSSAGAAQTSGGSGGTGAVTAVGGASGQASGVAGGGATGESGAASGGASSGAPGSGGASGAVSSGGSSGQPPVNGQCIFPTTASERKAPAFALPAPANPNGLILRLMNNCPIDLWVSGANLPAVELPPKQAGAAPAEKVYDWPGGGGRITAYLNAANGFNMAFIEFNAAKGKALNVDNSYVDWVGLPIEVKGNNTATCLTACYQPYAHMMDDCPAHLIDTTHKICQAPKNWCGTGNNSTDPICTSIVAAAAATAAADPKCNLGTDNAANIYGCGGKWNNNYCCAEVTRGYKTDIGDTNGNGTKNCNYYKEEPYSDYSAYSQKICPMIYSFAYDDWNNQSGIQTCPGVTEMDVTYCPGDP